jgi:hypothetical protein
MVGFEGYVAHGRHVAGDCSRRIVASRGQIDVVDNGWNVSTAVEVAPFSVLNLRIHENDGIYIPLPPRLYQWLLHL